MRGRSLMFLENDAKLSFDSLMSKTYETLCSYVFRGKRLPSYF